MTDLEIIVPIEPDFCQASLEHCLRGIAASTLIRSFTVSGVLVNNTTMPPPFRAFSGFEWTAVLYSGATELECVLEAIENARGTYVALVPPSHAIADKAWFGKMQLPFLRAPNVGLTVACDDQSGTGAQPFALDRGPPPGRVLMAARQTLAAIARTVPNPSVSTDYADAIILAARKLGLVTYAIPGVRIDIAGAPAATAARKESPSASHPGR